MTQHIPVLLQEVLRGLQVQPGQTVIDGTVGGGGHAAALLEASSPNGRLIGFDRDPGALAAAAQALARWGERVTLVRDSYANLEHHLARLKISDVHAVLLDLGLSSDQLQDPTRGFSFSRPGPLDLRFDTSQGQTAAELLQQASAEELERIFHNYGEEPEAGRLARAIVDERRRHPLHTTTDLLELVQRVKRSRRRSLHPGTLVWQALRMAVNHELEELAQGLESATRVLQPQGRLAVISFHSGEDRLVKDWFRREARDCVCPPEQPVCQCDHQARLKIITRRPQVPEPAEIRTNPRARSAKLRVVEKLPTASL